MTDHCALYLITDETAAQHGGAPGFDRSAKRSFERRVGRALLRRAARERLGLDTQAPIEIEDTPDKPRVPLLLREQIGYSISHSGNTVAVAIGPAMLGLDIERERPRRNLLAAAEFFCTADELSALRDQRSPIDQQRMFYQLWTQKEAYIKACWPASDIAALNQITCVSEASAGSDPLWTASGCTGDCIYSLATARPFSLSIHHGAEVDAKLQTQTVDAKFSAYRIVGKPLKRNV